MGPSDIFFDVYISLKIYGSHLLVLDIVYNSLEKSVQLCMKDLNIMYSEDRIEVWRSYLMNIKKNKKNDKYTFNIYHLKPEVQLFTCEITKQTVETIIDTLPDDHIHIDLGVEYM